MRKLRYSFGANIVSLLVSLLTVSVLPKYMTLADYGIYQLFLFYFGYVGFLHLGVLGGGIISDIVLHFLNKYKILVVRILSKFELRRVARAIRATILSKL